MSFPVLETRLPGPEGRKCVSPLTWRHFEPTKLEGNQGGGNVVIRRDLPTGKGERPSSHTPKPEDLNRGRGRSPGIRPGKNPTNKDPHESSPIYLEKETDPPRVELLLSTEGWGEVETDSKGFRPTATTEEGTRGRTRPTTSSSNGKPLKENLTPTDLIVVCDVISDTEGT